MNAATTLDGLSRYLHNDLSMWLGVLDESCLPSAATPGGETVWPCGTWLGKLDSAVFTLAVMERKKPFAKKLSISNWKTYKYVDKRWQRHHLVSRVKKLVLRARARLQEESELESKNASQSDPERWRREPFLEWIGGLGNSDFLDVIDMVYGPLRKGGPYSNPHQIVIGMRRMLRLVSERRRRDLDRKRQANRRLKLKERANNSKSKNPKIFLLKRRDAFARRKRVGSTEIA
jgi:hypothetical protein